MSNPTLATAAAALDALLSNGAATPLSERRSKKKKTPRSNTINKLDDASRAQREAEEKKRVDAAVKKVIASTKVRDGELQVRERILDMREEKRSKKRKAVIADFGNESD